MAIPAPLAVSAQLSLLAGSGDAITVTATDSLIVVALPRLSSLRSAMGPLADRRQRRHLMARLQDGLRVADLTVHFRVKSYLVAQLRPESEGTWLSRLLGLGGMEVRVIPCLLALLR